MTDQMIQALFQALGTIVSADGSWKDKKEAIVRACSDEDRTNLDEFVTWFEQEE